MAAVERLPVFESLMRPALRKSLGRSTHGSIGGWGESGDARSAGKSASGPPDLRTIGSSFFNRRRSNEWFIEEHRDKIDALGDRAKSHARQKS